MFDVIIPAYNAEATIADAVRSAEHAGASAILVVDDGSVDKTSAIAAAAGATVIRQENRGAAEARRHGAEDSSAEFVIFLDADDQLLRDGVQASIELLRLNAAAVAAGGGVCGILPNGRTVTVARSYERVIRTEDLIQKGFGAWPPGAAIIRRSAYFASLEMGTSKLSTRYAEDFEMFLRLSMVGEILAHRTPSIKYRMYDGKSSKNNVQPLLDKEKIRAHYAAATGVAYDAPTTAQIKASSMFRSARTKWARGERLGAIFAAASGAFVDPATTTKKLALHLRKVGTS